MSFYSFTALVNVIASSALGAFVYFKNKKAKTNRAFALFCLSTTVWSYAYYFWQLSDNASKALFWSRGLMAGAVFITIYYFYFVLRLLNKIKEGKKLLISGFLVFSFFFLTDFTPLLVKGVKPKLGFAFWPDAGILFHPFILIWFFYAIYAIYLLFRGYSASTGAKHIQIKYILVGTIIGYLGGATNYFLWYGIPIPPIGNWTAVFYLGIVAYAIVKYKFLNIKFFVAQILIVILNFIAFTYIFISETFEEYVIKTLFFLGILLVSYLLKKYFDKEIKQRQKLDQLAKKLKTANKRLQTMADRLAIANDQLRKLDNAKSEFISIASHQLRTPLTAIKGFVSLILEGSYGKINSEAKNALNKVYLSNERLIQLVEDLLNLSRIESGRMEYKFEKVNLIDICRELMDTFIIRAKEKHLKLELVFPKKPISEVLTDSTKIREVISNLVDNAIKYTLKGWVKIKLAQVGNNIRVSVIDTGIGVPKEEIPYLFAKFSRGKDISRLNTTGTGLGLHVGKKMVEALYGKIWLESPGVNRGSTFFVEIPVKLTKEEMQNVGK